MEWRRAVTAECGEDSHVEDEQQAEEHTRPRERDPLALAARSAQLLDDTGGALPKEALCLLLERVSLVTEQVLPREGWPRAEDQSWRLHCELLLLSSSNPRASATPSSKEGLRRREGRATHGAEGAEDGGE